MTTKTISTETDSGAGAAKTGASSRWFRFNLWLHRWTSLIATVPFLVLCLSGTVLIFHEEIDDATGIVPTAQAADAPQRPIAEGIANVLAAHPGERALSIGIDPEHHPGVLLVVTAAAAETTFDHATLRFADLATAQPIGESDPAKTLTGFLLELHAQWFLGPLGEVIGALIALLVFLSLLSGLVVYAPYVKRIAFGVLRRGRGARLLQLDLHNFIGAIVLGWALVVTVTGFLLGFSTVAIMVWQATELGAMRAQAGRMAPVDALRPPADADRAIAAALAKAEDGRQVTSLIFPDTSFSTPRHYTVLLNGRSGIERRLFTAAIVDAGSGELTTYAEPPTYLKAIILSEPLHFGDYGGLPLKLLWTACTWLTLFITANGAWLWWDRRRRRAAKAPLEGVPA
ncbi:PepSY-associated TM helix domain-containing protein [Solimonas soli]|uniref:PepSY-associated TM helix domain-containing protein n=1 Tax=Solimonas soli TaxID=413479 RepID=UPI0004ACDE1C|nr:PepSY-associated TM helix domain-containing protein [Solimonas soli]